MSPPPQEEFATLIPAHLRDPYHLPELTAPLESWRISLDLDLAASLRLDRFNTALSGFTKCLDLVSKVGITKRESLKDCIRACLWKDIEYLSVAPEPERVKQCLSTLLDILASDLSGSDQAAIDFFFVNFYINLNDIYTLEDVSLFIKEALSSIYVQSVSFRYPLSDAHGNMLRLCRLEGYSVLFDLVSQEAIYCWNVGQAGRARSVLIEQESTISVAIELEERFEIQLKNGKHSRVLKAWMKGLKSAGKEIGIDDGYIYKGCRIKLTKGDYEAYSAKCQAKALLAAGDMHFSSAMSGDEGELIGRALLAQDDYRAALNCVQEKDYELEGLALTRLARYYDKIVRLPHTAHQLYLNAVQLVLSQSSKNPDSDWYATATAAVQAHRDRATADEASKWSNARMQVLEKIKGDLLLLDQHYSDSTKDFIEFVWKKFPPKTAGTKDLPRDLVLKQQDGTVIVPIKVSKKAMVQVIARYHPDKHQPAWGDKWKALSEEICKCLNRRYEPVKMGDVA